MGPPRAALLFRSSDHPLASRHLHARGRRRVSATIEYVCAPSFTGLRPARGCRFRERAQNMEVIIVGAGIGGLTLALTLHRAGIAARLYESAAELRPLGAGINVLPHASTELARLGLQGALSQLAVETREAVFFNRFG